MTEQNHQLNKSLWRYKLLRLLHYYLYRTHCAFLKYKKLVSVILFAFIIFSIALGTKTKIAVRTEDFSDQKLPSYQAMRELKEEYSFEDKLTLIINKKTPLNNQDLCQIQNWLRKEVNTNPDIGGFNSLFNLRIPEYSNGLLFYPQIVESPCEDKVDYVTLKKHPLLTMFSTPELTDFVIHFEINPAEKEFRHGIYDYKALDRIIESAKKSLPFEIIPGGTLFFQSSVLSGIEYSNVINIMASVLLFSGYYLFYRSFMGAFALLAVILITNSMIKAGMAYFGHMIDPLSSCIFLMITVSSIEDYILFSFLVFKQKTPFNLAAKKLLLPSFLTSLTTAIGFGSLAVSSNPSIVHFSIWTALGAMFEWAAMFLIIPVFVNLFPSIRKRIDAHPKPKRIVPVKLITYTPPKVIAVIIALIPLVIVFMYDKANLSYSPYDMFTKTHQVSKFREHLLETRQSEGELSIVFKNMDEDISSYVEAIKKDPAVAGVFSEMDIKKEVILFPEFLQKLIFEDFKRTDLGKLFIARDSKRIIAYIKSYDTKDVPVVVSRIQNICGDKCSIKSEIIVSKDYAVGILQTLYDSAVSGFFSIIVLISWLVFTISRKHTVPVLLSTLWASFMLLILVVVFQFKINVVTCVALSVLIGLAGDNAIQFLLLQKDSLSESVEEVGEASTENFLLMLLLSGTLFFSYFQTPRTLALLMIIGIILMFIGDLWVLNGLTAISDGKSKPKSKS
ncbi:putative RND superfamily exporter protein [Bacteriovorax stolpii]|nr:putative RND superfamily exporter protein [Bacteriovorax stolpii]